MIAVKNIISINIVDLEKNNKTNNSKITLKIKNINKHNK